MRRTASEVIRSLESRIARLEDKTARKDKTPKWVKEALAECAKRRLIDLKDLETTRSGEIWEWANREETIVLLEEGREDLYLYETQDDLHNHVREHLTEEMEEDTAQFIQMFDYIKGRLFMRAGDINYYVGDFANIDEDDYDDDDLIEMAGMGDQRDEAQELIDMYSEQIDPFLPNGRPNPNYRDYAEVYLFDAQNALNDLPERALASLQAEREREVEDALKQYPFEYLTEDLGFPEDKAVEMLTLDVEGALDDIFASERADQMGPHGSDVTYLSNAVLVKG